MREYRWRKLYLKGKLRASSYLKMRIISRRYFRKLSEEPARKASVAERKVSWGDEVEVIIFQKEEAPGAVGETEVLVEATACAE